VRYSVPSTDFYNTKMKAPFIEYDKEPIYTVRVSSIDTMISH